MLRFVCREVDIGAAANVGGPVNVTLHTFDSAKDAEAWLLGTREWVTRECLGIELLAAPEEPTK